MKLKDKHFWLFKTECEKNLKRLGLMSWNIYYLFEKIDSVAKVFYDYKGMVATIILNTEFDDIVEANGVDKTVREAALHECLELLLAPMNILAKGREWNADTFEKENHAVIRTLEKLLL